MCSDEQVTGKVLIGVAWVGLKCHLHGVKNDWSWAFHVEHHRMLHFSVDVDVQRRRRRWWWWCTFSMMLFSSIELGRSEMYNLSDAWPKNWKMLYLCLCIYLTLSLSLCVKVFSTHWLSTYTSLVFTTTFVCMPTMYTYIRMCGSLNLYINRSLCVSVLSTHCFSVLYFVSILHFYFLATYYFGSSLLLPRYLPTYTFVY